MTGKNVIFRVTLAASKPSEAGEAGGAHGAPAWERRGA